MIAEKTRQAELDRIEKQREEEGLRNEQKKRENSLIPKGKDFTIPNLGMDFVFVENGSFQMGSNDGYDDEKPVHKVTLSNDFWIGKYQVTQSEYKDIMGESPGFFKGNKNPVEIVSWNDCVEFCERLTIQEEKAGRLSLGASYRLPTEAELEYCAKGGNKSRAYKYSGSDFINRVAWYDDNSGEETHPVGEKSSNELGLYDMSGNVWEWCSDWFDSKYYTNSASTNPRGASSGSARVFRGGSWNDKSSYCRSADRGNRSPSGAFDALGFRLCLGL